ncbi:glycoside hydrolase family 95 protein [Marinimicrobium alkaliphilum]|uniref:glycoside hydrolase family 95 protein n=1 Tax=Marinimicrobium alkaliphilum TaxID=2202654 RepID=UPI001300683A|nr:glycoside hydrolase family 95 protein [Marinimicrobium alkaliphilum]
MSNAEPLSLWYDAPGEDWETQGLPIGNGAMGAVILGGTELELIQFNEKSLWTGGPGAQGYNFGWPDASLKNAVRAVQQDLFREGELEPEAVAERLGQPMVAYGDYQTFGDLWLRYSGSDAPVEDYRRALDLERGVIEITYRRGERQYRREYFASYPAGVIAVRLSVDKPGELDLSVGLQIPDNRSAEFTASDDGALSVRGALADNGLAYYARLQVTTDGDVVMQNDSAVTSADGHRSPAFHIAGADTVTLILSGATDYASDYPSYRGSLPVAAVNERVERASNQDFAALHAQHEADHRALFERMSLDIGQAPVDEPTDRLLAEYAGTDTPEARWLEAVYFQYGRYLLIASSRPGSLPANLQGVWNHSNTPPWHADYHVNINLQMNYWPALVTGLEETAEPLLDFIDSLVEPGRVAAERIYGAGGWTLSLNTNVWGFTGLIEWPTAFWQPEAAAWLMQHYHEHYLFTRDETLLRERAWPVMREAAQFWLDFLIEDPDTGELVVAPSYSPEHGPFVVGAAMSQQMVYDLFARVLESAEVLGRDDAWLAQLRTAKAKLDPGLRIGRWGQLQEWRADIDDPDNHHRHISHLFALHPGRQLTEDNRTYRDAAQRSLEARGDGGTGWAQAWKINQWARLHDGDRAHKLLHDQLRQSTLSNLWGNHPPFQIDGNFGATAGVAEMLIQSHLNVINLLPALPSAWPEGSAQGLRARGNVVVDLHWREGRLQRAELHSAHAQELTVRTRVPVRAELTDTGAAVPLRAHDDRVSFRLPGDQSVTLYAISESD